ncbi:hypothetical protein CCHL11_06866 [Colletotrichum chlorophyti]|uniref:N-acetyltransferase domain-containing protein n=1 Tax=Colletotrichum chlorophyti TaxID=708187 RepID=A0A1Q8S9I9_9PEZI|nr:hypothetical protein CCHL11_06866 [Colletotrichum chlorophyti]
MPIEVHPVLEADFRRCAEVEHLAFAELPDNKFLFPGPMPEDFLELRGSDLAKQTREDPTVRFFKAVDTDLSGDEAIVAFAKWNVHSDGMPVPKPRVWGPGCNVEACNLLFGGFDKMRERLMSGKACVYLHILVTDPKHQRRGAGMKLLTWGMQEAVRLSIPVYLESSAAGHPLYLKAGFKDVEEQRVDFSEFGPPRRPHLTFAMIWELPSKRCP